MPHNVGHQTCIKTATDAWDLITAKRVDIVISLASHEGGGDAGDAIRYIIVSTIGMGN